MLNDKGQEVFLIRLNGGPKAGDRMMVLEWPPPETIPPPPEDPQIGYYERIRMSNLPDEVGKHPNITRGAEYIWKSTEHLYN